MKLYAKFAVLVFGLQAALGASAVAQTEIEAYGLCMYDLHTHLASQGRSSFVDVDFREGNSYVLLIPTQRATPQGSKTGFYAIPLRYNKVTDKKELRGVYFVKIPDKIANINDTVALSFRIPGAKDDTMIAFYAPFIKDDFRLAQYHRIDRYPYVNPTVDLPTNMWANKESAKEYSYPAEPAPQFMRAQVVDAIDDQAREQISAHLSFNAFRFVAYWKKYQYACSKSPNLTGLDCSSAGARSEKARLRDTLNSCNEALRGTPLQRRFEQAKQLIEGSGGGTPESSRLESPTSGSEAAPAH